MLAANTTGHAAQRVLITGTQAGGPASRRRAAARGQDPVKQPGSSGGHQGQIEVATGHGPGVAGPVPGVTVKLAWRRSCLVRQQPLGLRPALERWIPEVIEAAAT